ncbi:hypothetical protein AB6A23_21445 [Paenibacillus tarimensis]
MDNPNNGNLSSRKQLEEELAERLTEGPMAQEPHQAEDKQEMIRRRLPARYEIRIQTPLDPIVKETERYRQLAKEIDDRYDRYMYRAKSAGSQESEPEEK